MQSNTETARRFQPDTACVNSKQATMFSLPFIEPNAFGFAYKEASCHLFKADKKTKTDAAVTILQSEKLNLINTIDIDRAFKDHQSGKTVEIEMLNLLSSQCIDKLRETCLVDDYEMSVDIIKDKCVLAGYDLHQINIDTEGLKPCERWIIYASLEIVAQYQLPLMPPHWSISASYCLMTEIIDSDEYDAFINLSIDYGTTNEILEIINTDPNFEYLSLFLDEMNNDLTATFFALLEYECLDIDSKNVSQYQKTNHLTLEQCNSKNDQIEKHIALLEKYTSDESVILLRLLKQLLRSNLYIEFNRIEEEEAQPLDFSITVIDKKYNNLLHYIQEQKLDELNDVGEPLSEYISFDDNVLDRLNLLTYAFKNLKQLNPDTL